VRRVEDSIALFGKDPAITEENLTASVVAAEKELMRGACKGVLHKNAASRKVSRLSCKVRKVLSMFNS
jgi:small subunit ribosomal protein S20